MALAEADPEKTQVCHCTDCQTATGTAFRVSIPVPGATLKITGKPAIYVKTTAESGRPRVQTFCGTYLRLADLFDHARSRRAALLHAAGRHFAPARPAHAAAPVLVAIGAAMGHARDEYVALANRMNELAQTMPGYISHKDFYANDGERVAVVEFAHAEGQRAWQTNPEHRAAQKLAREKYYTEYHIQVCTLDRESKFKLPEQAKAQT